MNVNHELQILCKKHESLYQRLNLNPVAVMGYLTQHVLTKMSKESSSKEDFSSRIAAFKGAMCCTLSEDEHDEMIGSLPQSTGHPGDDEQEALAIIPSMGRVEPSDLESSSGEVEDS